MTCTADVVQCRTMDKRTSLLDQLKAVRDSLDLQNPIVRVSRWEDSGSIRTWKVSDCSAPLVSPIVTMNDTDQILADLAEVL